MLSFDFGFDPGGVVAVALPDEDKCFCDSKIGLTEVPSVEHERLRRCFADRL